jgi:hypothetical protein
MRLTVASFIRTIRSVGRAVAYIDAHLDEELDLRRDVSVPGYTPPSEHHRQLWLPVAARIVAGPVLTPGIFTLPHVRRHCT